MCCRWSASRASSRAPSHTSSTHGAPGCFMHQVFARKQVLPGACWVPDSCDCTCAHLPACVPRRTATDHPYCAAEPSQATRPAAPRTCRAANQPTALCHTCMYICAGAVTAYCTSLPTSSCTNLLYRITGTVTRVYASISIYISTSESICLHLSSISMSTQGQ